MSSNNGFRPIVSFCSRRDEEATRKKEVNSFRIDVMTLIDEIAFLRTQDNPNKESEHVWSQRNTREDVYAWFLLLQRRKLSDQALFDVSS